MATAETWTMGSSGIHKTVRGGIPQSPVTSAKDAPPSRRAVRAHASEVQQLLIEIENLTRQRTELLVVTRAHDAQLAAERLRRQKAEKRLEKLRVRSETTVNMLLARETALAEELKFAYELLAAKPDDKPSGNEPTPGEEGERRTPYTAWVAGLREERGETIVDDIFNEEDGNTDVAPSPQRDGRGDDAGGFPRAEEPAPGPALAATPRRASSPERAAERAFPSRPKERARGPAMAVAMEPAEADRWPPSLRHTHHWVQEDPGTPFGREAQKRNSKSLTAAQAKARAGSDRAVAGAAKHSSEQIAEAIERDRCVLVSQTTSLEHFAGAPTSRRLLSGQESRAHQGDRGSELAVGAAAHCEAAARSLAGPGAAQRHPHENGSNEARTGPVLILSPGCIEVLRLQSYALAQNYGFSCTVRLGKTKGHHLRYRNRCHWIRTSVRAHAECITALCGYALGQSVSPLPSIIKRTRYRR